MTAPGGSIGGPNHVQVYGEPHPETIGARLNLATVPSHGRELRSRGRGMREGMVSGEEHFGPDIPMSAMNRQ